MSLDVFSPAKINLFLAITGRRADGFHELVSVVAQLEHGDSLQIEPVSGVDFVLTCDDPEVPVDGSNLVLRAARLFREETGWKSGARFALRKRTPMGAGLGGGSSNAAAALTGLNRLAGNPLSPVTLTTLAVRLGSDCALFLRDGPVVMRGRGERVEDLPPAAAARMHGQRLLVFKPPFGVSTAWAYGRMAAGAPRHYLEVREAEARLAGWLAAGSAPLAELLYNNMETVAFEKHLALPSLLGRLREKFALAVAMSGSGSACFGLLKNDTPVEAIVREIREAWGPGAFVAETRIR